MHRQSCGYARTDIDDHPLLVPSLFSGHYIQPAGQEDEHPRNYIGMSSVAIVACTKSKPCQSAAYRPGQLCDVVHHARRGVSAAR